MLRLFIVILFLVIYIIFYFRKMGLKAGITKFNEKYLFSIIFTVITALAIYGGIVYILKAFNIMIDMNFYEDNVYTFLAGLVIVFFSLIMLKDKILKDFPKK